MDRFNVSAKALAKWYLEEQYDEYEDQGDLMKILRNQSTIYTIGYNAPKDYFVEEDDTSLDAVLFSMSMAYQIKFKPRDSYLRELSEFESAKKVLEKPNDVFLLDVDENYAKEVELDYGVIFRSTRKKIDTSVFTKDCFPISFKKNKKAEGGWKDLFSIPSKVPSNSLCIIDRHLFSYDGGNNPNEGHKDDVIYNGINTVALILYNALPSVFKGNYHVTIVCDIDSIKNRLVFQTLQVRLFDCIYGISLMKGYTITADLFAVNDKQTKYARHVTHNRQIMSNYYQMCFPNGINAIRLYEGKSQGTAEYKQKVQAQLLFNSCLDFLRAGSPCKDIDDTIASFAKITFKWKTNDYVPDHYKYANNDWNSSVKHFKNRMFTQYSQTNY